MTALKPTVHQTVTPTSDTQPAGRDVVQAIESGSPRLPSRWFTGPTLASSRKCHSTPTTATPSTYGAKYTARKNVRPGNLRFKSSASAKGTATSSGTESTVKIAVTRIPLQNSSASTP